MSNELVECPDCHGEGYVNVPTDILDGYPESCERCGRTGEVDINDLAEAESDCEFCGDQGGCPQCQGAVGYQGRRP